MRNGSYCDQGPVKYSGDSQYKSNSNLPFGENPNIKKSLNTGSVYWRSPSNIALIKYWGKRKGQMPENPSLSITLSKSYTETLLSFYPASETEGKLKSYIFEGKQEESFTLRINDYLKNIQHLYPFLSEFDLNIESRNSFPHSSGIASSAAAMSALALCLTSMERLLYGSQSNNESFFRKASYVARIGSGSAARSVYPGYVLWGRSKFVTDSADEYAIPVNDKIHKNFRDMRDSILIVDESPKTVSSSMGHSLMLRNPWSAIRYEQAKKHTVSIMQVLSSGDLDEFVSIVEKEALTLHSLMMNSDPGYILLKPGTLEIIEKVRQFRYETKVPVAFTLDAGPNVHLIYPGKFHDEVIVFLEEKLKPYCSNGKWIDDSAGNGPVEINTQ